MAVTFGEPGSDATFGLQWYVTTGAVSSSATQARTGPRSILCDSTGTNSPAIVTANLVLADAGRRVAFGYRVQTNLPTTTASIFTAATNANLALFNLQLQTSGILRLTNDSAGFVAGSTVLGVDTWYHLAVGYTVTSTTNFQIRVWVNGVLEITASNTNFTLPRTVSSTARFGWISAPGANRVAFVDDVYVDSDTPLVYPGAVRVTARLPTTTSLNLFDGTGGTGAVNERPINLTNRKTHASALNAAQTYNLEALASGDVNLTGKTIRAQVAWIWAAKGLGSGTSEELKTSAADLPIALTTSPALYQFIDNRTTYDATAATGINDTTQGDADVFLYECGALVVYTDPAADTTVTPAAADVTLTTFAPLLAFGLTLAPAASLILTAFKPTVTNTSVPQLVVAEGGTDASFDLEFWTPGGDAVPTSSTEQAHTGPRSLKFDTGAGGGTSHVHRDDVLADTGGKAAFWLRLSGALPANYGFLFLGFNPGITPVVYVRYRTDGGVLEFNGPLGTTAIALDTWYHVVITWTIQSASVWEVRGYVNGVQEVQSVNSYTLDGTGVAHAYFGWIQSDFGFGANRVLYLDDVVVTTNPDNHAYPGALRVTYKAPTSVLVGGFDTIVGTGAVNERPFSATNYVRHEGETWAQQSYSVQPQSVGDADLTAAAIVGYNAWLWATEDPGSTGEQEAILYNGMGTTIALPGATGLVEKLVTDTAYPASVGMLSTGGDRDTALVDLGVSVVYVEVMFVTLTPAAVSLTLTSFAPTITTPVTLTPSAAAALTLTAFAPTVSTPVLVTPTAAALIATAFPPTVTAAAGVTVTPPAAALTLTSFAPSVDVAPLWGTLLSDASRAATAVATGVDVVHQELGWDLYETADGTFSAAYAAASLADLTTWRTAGLRVALGAGIWYPPTWVMGLTNAHFKNQDGNTPPAVYDKPNTVFSQAMRDQVAAYYTRIQSDLGLNNYWAIRLGAAGNVEPLYPHANDGAGETNSWWFYDTNAQTGSADLPAGVGIVPVASYVPGAGTAAEAEAILTWYMDALVNDLNWQITLLRDTLGYDGYIILVIPGVAVQPWLLPHIYNDLLAGTIDASRVSNRGAIWHFVADGITNKEKVIFYCSSAADDSGSPPNNWSEAGDATIDIVNDEAVRDFSAMRWIQTLAWQYGYDYGGGENPDASHGSYGPAMLDTLGKQATAAKYFVAFVAHEDDLASGAVVDWGDLAQTISTTYVLANDATLTLTAFAPTVTVTSGVTVFPDVATLTLTAFAPTVSTPVTVTPAAAALFVTAFAPTLVTPVTVTPTTGTLTLTAFAPTVTAAAAVTVTPAAATLVLTAFAPSLALPGLVTPATATLALTAFAPTVVTPVTVTPAAAALTLTAFAPTVTATAHVTVTPAAAALTLTAFAPTLVLPGVLTPATATLVLTGLAPTVTLTANVTVTPGAASLTLTAFAPTVTLATAVTPAAATLTVTAFAPTVTMTAAVTVTPAAALLALTTFAPVVVAAENVTVTPGSGALTLTGFAVQLQQAITPAAAALALTTFAPLVQTTAGVFVRPALVVRDRLQMHAVALDRPAAALTVGDTDGAAAVAGDRSGP